MLGLLPLAAVACGNEQDLFGDVLPDVVPLPYDPPSTTQEDIILQVTEPIVDTLFIVDNSCSMENNQDKLTANFPNFINFFTSSGLDYHVGVVSTDMDAPSSSGKLREVNGERWIDPETNDPNGVFEIMAGMGISGSGTEKGLEAGYTALEKLIDPGKYNEGFVREDATLHLIVISDEEDQSNSPDRDEFTDWLLDYKDEPDQVSFSSIVWQPGVPPTIYGESSGDDYIFVTNHVGGINFDINQSDWSVVLEELGVQAAGLKREFFLSQIPVVDTIEVTIRDGAAVTAFGNDEWFYTEGRNSVTFNTFIPDPMTEIHITYQILSAIEDDQAAEDVIGE
jgi:hypothetical protein